MVGWFAEVMGVMLELLRHLGHRELCRRGEYQTRQVQGATIGYYRFGQGDRTVVLMHGLGDSALSWRQMALTLSRHARVVVPELPGFGRSMLPTGRDHLSPAEYRQVLHEFLEPFASERPLLVGNSMGGWYSAQLLLDAPERYDGVVLINPGGALVDDPEGGGEAFFAFLASASGRAIVDRLFHRPPFYSGLIASGIAAQMRSPVVQQFALQIRLEDLLGPEHIRRLPARSTLVWGERDLFLPAGTGEVFLEHFPGRIVRLPHVAHMGHVEAPRRICDVVLETLNG